MSVFVAIPVMLLLLLLKGLFSGSEIALVNADKIRLKRMAKSGHKGSPMVLKAFEHPDELLSNTLIGTNIATIALTTIGTLPGREQWRSGHAQQGSATAGTQLLRYTCVAGDDSD